MDARDHDLELLDLLAQPVQTPSRMRLRLPRIASRGAGTRLSLVLPLAILASSLAACGGAPYRTLHYKGRLPSSADTALAPGDDRAAFAAIDPKLDRLTGSIAHGGNHVELLIDGVESFARRFENARTADLILVKTFVFTDDETGRAAADVLAARARAGAFVVLQYDVKGSIGGAGDIETMIAHGGDKGIIGQLRAAGVHIVPANTPIGDIGLRDVSSAVERTVFHPFDVLDRSLTWAHRLDFRDHEKYWITGTLAPDGQLVLRAIMGGMNVASEYAFGGTTRVDMHTGVRGWRDTDVEIMGPVLNDIVDRFFDVMDVQLGHRLDPAVRARWNPRQPIAGSARVRFVYNHPWFNNRHAIEELYTALIDAVPPGGVARLETAYFAPPSSIRKALRRALDRATRLVVISNSAQTSDAAPVMLATRSSYYALLDAEPTSALYERIARPDLGEVMIHCKIASFGTQGPVIIGSANLDAQSAEHNSESVLVIEDPELRARFDAMFETDLAPGHASRVTIETIEGNPAWNRVREWAMAQLAWYWL